VGGCGQDTDYPSREMTELLLVRHGETDWNRDERFQGHADPPLNDTGRAQARALANDLGRERIDAIYTSDLARARETAELIAEGVGVPFILEPRLREVDVGEWQGLRRPEIAERFPDGMRNWHERGHGWERGETYEQLAERVLEAVEWIVNRHPGGRVVVVGHGGTIRVIRAHVDESTVVEHRRVLPAALNCEVFRISAENGTLRRLD
jgi:probable phosphoglycerate mutase